jgi:hypothetical protein
MTGAKRARVRTRRLPASWRGYGRRLRIARLTLGAQGEAAAALGNYDADVSAMGGQALATRAGGGNLSVCRDLQGEH